MRYRIKVSLFFGRGDFFLYSKGIFTVDGILNYWRGRGYDSAILMALYERKSGKWCLLQTRFFPGYVTLDEGT